MNVWTGEAAVSGTMVDYTFDVPGGYEEVTVVLAWADEAGSNEVINDLDIVYVLDGDGTVTGSSVSNDDTVEYHKVPSGYDGGTWTARISALSLASSQTYALAAHTVLEPADLSINCSPEPYPGPEDYYYINKTISNSGYTAGGSFAVLSVPDEFNVLGVEIYTQEGIYKYRDATRLYMSLVRVTGRSRLDRRLPATTATSAGSLNMTPISFRGITTLAIRLHGAWGGLP